MKELIESFVRETLGCNCPAEVFEKIDVVKEIPLFQELPYHSLIKIGGKLCLLMVTIDDALNLKDELHSYFHRGSYYRDKNDFNRFRLVLACDNAGVAAPVLNYAFMDMSGFDDRIHLHVLPRSEMTMLFEALDGLASE